MSLEHEEVEKFIDESEELDRLVRSMEHLIYVEEIEPDIEVSMEEGSDLRQPSYLKASVLPMANALVGTARKLGRMTIEHAPKIVDLAKKFAEKLAEYTNKVSTLLSKVLATGYPMMGKIRKKADALGDRAKVSESVEGKLKLPKVAKSVMIDGEVKSGRDIVRELDQILEITEAILSDDKLDKFTRYSNDMLEPFKDSISGSKVDGLVTTLGILALVTNPGTIVGEVLKKLFSATNPGMGDKVAKAATLGGGLYAGIGSLVIASGATAGVTLRQIQQGKLNTSVVPKFAEIYSFCNNEVKDDEKRITTTKRTDVLMGDRYWEVTDYSDELKPSDNGGLAGLGGKFKKVKRDKKEKQEIPELEPLTPEEVQAISERVSKIMELTMAYSKRWPDYSKKYIEQYRNISDTVMAYVGEAQEDSEGKVKIKLTTKYVRYTYRNTMNLLLGGMWRNCFGADNSYVRYLVGLCHNLTKYCDKSIAAKDEEAEPEEGDG